MAGVEGGEDGLGEAEATDSRVTDALASSNLNEALPRGTSRPGLGLLVRREGGLPAEASLPLAFARVRPSLVRARINAAFELRQPSEHRQHKSAMCRGRVGPSIRQGSEASPGLRHGVEDVEQITGRSRKPVEASDQQNVASAQCR